MPQAAKQVPGIQREVSGPAWSRGATRAEQAESAPTFLAMLVKWAPQDLQLGSEPVGEGKELYPGLE